MIYSETSSHTNTASPRLFLLHHWPEVDFVLSVSDGAFRIAVPAGVEIDWADYLPQDPVPRTAYETVPALDEDGRPFVDEDGHPATVQQEIAVYDARPDLRVPRDPWLWYQQEHGIETPQPTPEQVLAWMPPEEDPEPSDPLTDVERTFLRVQAKLNADEEKRTGKPVNPDGAVPLSRAIAATAIIYNGWHYPSIEDLETEFNQFLLSKIYADPATNTTAESSTEQKQSALHFTLVMLAGQAFGVDYQAELGAYERTASQDFQLKLKDDDRDWLKLPCPKMHKDWPAFDTIKAMFQAVME